MQSQFNSGIRQFKYLHTLGVEEKVAQLDAEGTERHVHQFTIVRITSFVDVQHERLGSRSSRKL